MRSMVGYSSGQQIGQVRELSAFVLHDYLV